MKGWIKLFGLVLIAGCTSNTATNNNTTAQLVDKVASQKKNVLFIAIDDLRPEISCYGNSHMLTPNLDELSAAGVTFDKAYCNVPVCGASRASLMTGHRPNRSRFYTYYSRADKDLDSVPTIGEWFKTQGYYSISNGKIFHNVKDSPESWSESPFRGEKGNWRDYANKANLDWLAANNTKAGPSHEVGEVGDYGYADGRTLKKSVADLKKLKASGQPFFMAVGFLKPHLPFNAPKKYWDLYNREDIKVADNPFGPEDAPQASFHKWGELRAYTDIPKEGPVSDSTAITLRHGYYACVSYTDKLVGELIDTLKALDMYDNTLIVLWGDHGYTLGEHGLWCKHSCYDLAMRVPLMIIDPGCKKGARVGDVVELVDLFPTLCEMSGIDKPKNLQGESLKSYILTGNGKQNTSYTRFQIGESVIQGDYNYTEYVSKSGQFKGAMLYDHTTDPEENTNVLGKPGYEKITEILKSSLDSMRNVIYE